MEPNYLNATIAYTDGSVKKNDSSSVALITSHGYFMAELTATRSSKAVIFRAELEAVMLAMLYFEETPGLAPPFVIYTDSLAVVDIYEQRELKDIRKFTTIWRPIKEIGERLKVNIWHVKAHKPVMNPNTACDLTAKALCGTDL